MYNVVNKINNIRTLLFIYNDDNLATGPVQHEPSQCSDSVDGRKPDGIKGEPKGTNERPIPRTRRKHSVCSGTESTYV